MIRINITKLTPLKLRPAVLGIRLIFFDQQLIPTQFQTSWEFNNLFQYNSRVRQINTIQPLSYCIAIQLTDQ